MWQYPPESVVTVGIPPRRDDRPSAAKTSSHRAATISVEVRKLFGRSTSASSSKFFTCWRAAVATGTSIFYSVFAA